MQRKFVADRARLRRANPFTSHHCQRMDRRIDVDAPRVVEFVELRIARHQIVQLRYEALNKRWVIRYVVKNFRRCETIRFELQLHVMHCPTFLLAQTFLI